MDKQTLTNYGLIVVTTLVLVIMIAFTTPFGTYVSNAVKSTTQGLFDVHKHSMNDIDVVIDNQQFDDTYDESTEPTPIECTHTNTSIINANIAYTGDIYCNECKTIIKTGSIISNSGSSELNPAGIDFGNGRTEPQIYDVYRYGDYEYCYKCAWCDACQEWFNPEDGDYEISCVGWSVRLIADTAKSSYGSILESINGMSITNMSGVFKGCINLTTAPLIPKSVTEMTVCFMDCILLESKPIIPDGVITSEENIFRNCSQFGY